MVWKPLANRRFFQCIDQCSGRNQAALAARLQCWEEWVGPQARSSDGETTSPPENLFPVHLVSNLASKYERGLPLIRARTPNPQISFLLDKKIIATAMHHFRGLSKTEWNYYLSFEPSAHLRVIEEDAFPELDFCEVVFVKVRQSLTRFHWQLEITLVMKPWMQNTNPACKVFHKQLLYILTLWNQLTRATHCPHCRSRPTPY